VPVRVEPNDDHGYTRAAKTAWANGVLIELNEYGCWRSVHHCATCGQRFTICPPSLTHRDACTIEGCPTYDPALDAEIYFLPDDPGLIEP
jgi:hypothetical protein